VSEAEPPPDRFLLVHLAADGGIFGRTEDAPRYLLHSDLLRDQLESLDRRLEVSAEQGELVPATLGIIRASGVAFDPVPVPDDMQLPLGLTTLMVAARQGSDAVLHDLTRRGASLEMLDDDGLTALMHAALFGQTEAIQHLVDSGAVVDARDPQGRTALMAAAAGGWGRAATALLELGADAAATSTNGQDAAAWAMENGHQDLARRLLDNQSPDAGAG